MSWRDHTLRHLRLWQECLNQAVRRDLQFRSQTFTTAVTAIIDLGLALVPVLIMTSATAGRGGWSWPLATAVVGAYGLGSSLIDCFVSPNLRRMDTYVRRGDLDLVLIRPVYAPLYTTLRWIRPSELTGALSGAALLITGLHLAHQPISAPAALGARGSRRGRVDHRWRGRLLTVLDQPVLPLVLARQRRTRQRDRPAATRGRPVPAGLLPTRSPTRLHQRHPGRTDRDDARRDTDRINIHTVAPLGGMRLCVRRDRHAVALEARAAAILQCQQLRPAIAHRHPQSTARCRRPEDFDRCSDTHQRHVSEKRVRYKQFPQVRGSPERRQPETHLAPGVDQ